MDRPIERMPTPWRRRRPSIVGLALAVAGSVLWNALPESGSTDIAETTIDTATIRKGSFDDYVPMRGTVAPAVATLVDVLHGGRGEHLLAQNGETVSAGQPLVAPANPELPLEMPMREAQIAGQLGSLAGETLGMGRARLNRAGQISQADYDLIETRRELGIRRQLHHQGFVSQEEARSFAGGADYRERRLVRLRAGGAAEARIAATQAARLVETQRRLSESLNAVRAGLDALTIYAPIVGRLTNFVLQPGQALKPGDPAGQVDSEDSWKLEADIDEYSLGRVRAGQKANVGNARATVSRVSPAVAQGRFRTDLTFEGHPPAGLNRGQTIDTRITLGVARRALIAPTGAWLDVDGNASTFVLDADGRHARRRSVRLARRNPRAVEILDGIMPGERIATSNISSLRGDVLNIR